MNRLLLLVVASYLTAAPAIAGSRGFVGETQVATGNEMLRPEVQAAQFETQYGLSDRQRLEFNLGARYTIDDLPQRPYYNQGPEEGAGKLESRGVFKPMLALPPGASEREALESAPAKVGSETPRRSLVDAPSPIPPVPFRTPPPPAQGLTIPGHKTAAPSALSAFGSAVHAVPGEVGATVLTPAPFAGRKLLDNLRQPSAFRPADIGGMTPEGAAAAGQVDYGRRVLGQASRTAVPVAPSIAGSLQSYPLAVVVELRLSGPLAPPLGGSGEAQAGAATPQAGAERLAKEAGFLLDPSFPPLMSSPNRRTAFLRGWVSSDRLMALTLHPLVARLSVAGGAAMSASGRLLEIPVTLYLRMRPGEGLADFVSRTVEALERQAGFRWRVSRGYQLLPSAAGNTMLLAGELPVAAVERLLNYPDLVRVEPYLTATETAPRASTPAPPRAIPAARKALDWAVLTTAFPWMGILVREIFFWIQFAF